MKPYHVQNLMRVLVYIEEHLDEPLNLDRIAEIACISPFHFHRLFRAFVGEPVAAYIRRLRMQRAAGELVYSERQVTDIGFDTGYETSSAFAKGFGQLMGLSPQKYRKALTPAVRSMLRNTKGDFMLEPTVVERAEEELLFVRRVGDYRQTPREAVRALVKQLEADNLLDSVTAIYGMGLDNPEIAETNKLRFDACAAVPNARVSGELGKKTLRGGRYVVFLHEGPRNELEKVFLDILAKWYPSSGETLADHPSFCEYLDLAHHSIAPEKQRTKCWVPLKSDGEV